MPRRLAVIVPPAARISATSSKACSGLMSPLVTGLNQPQLREFGMPGQVVAGEPGAERSAERRLGHLGRLDGKAPEQPAQDGRVER